MIDPQLASFATVRQLEYLEAVEKYGSNVKAAKALGVGRRVVDKAIQLLRATAAAKGYAPGLAGMDGQLSAVERLKGRSIYFDPVKGVAEKVWIKTDVDQEKRQELIRAAFEAMAQELPRLGATVPISVAQDALATLYTLTDCHVGMLAWAKETGADWDLKIAEATLVGCFAQMVNASPPARVGFVNQLGDFLHYDSMLPVTPTHGHILDADGRLAKMVTTAVRILRRIIDLALTRHEKVVVLMAEGNHDMASSVWLRVMFRALYENEPRVEVIDSEMPYYAYQHGKTMLTFHHGHLKKKEQLPILFASQFPEMWGATLKRYCHTGHMHHADEKEHSGMTVIQHPTLAARDAHSSRGGYVSERSVTAITYHSQYGQVARNTVVPEMLS